MFSAVMPIFCQSGDKSKNDRVCRIRKFVHDSYHWWQYFKLSDSIVIRNGKIVWKHRLHCWYFCLNLKYLGWPYWEYIKAARNGGFCSELLSGNDFEAVLATFYFMTVIPTPLKQFKRSLQIKKIITNAPRVL